MNSQGGKGILDLKETGNTIAGDGDFEDIKTEILKEGDNPVSEIKKEIEKVKEAAQNANPIKDLKEDILSSKPKNSSETTTEVEETPVVKPSEDESYEGPVSR